MSTPEKYQNYKMKMNLQHFADPGQGQGNGQGQQGGDPGQQGQGQQGQEQQGSEPGQGQQGSESDETFTQSDVDSAVSKAVDKALKNQATKLEQEKQQAIEDAKKDAANYAKMTKAQQEEADYNKRLKALEDRERELNTKQLRSEVQADLQKEGLPTDFAESLISLEDNEKIKESIGNIKKTFDEAVNAAVKEKLRQDPPAAGTQQMTGSGQNKSKAEMAKKARII